MTNTDYVWYASYGSNINKNRFLCYILGGTPKGSAKDEKGCRDKSLPKDERAYKIQHQMYFAKESSSWQGGVCFIGLEQDPSYETYSYMYLIKREQFLDVVRQENACENIDIDLEEVISKGNKVIGKSWYGNILCLGDNEGYPVFTFTSIDEINPLNVRKPSKEYLLTIILGLKAQIGLDDNQILKYLKKTPGITGQISNEDLLRIIAEAHV